MTVKGLDGCIGCVVVHFNETESARTTGFTIVDQSDRMNGSVLTEQLVHFFIGCTER